VPATDAARTPGTALYWGNFIVNQEDVDVLDEAAKGGKVVALASGSEHVLALKQGGKVLAWGADSDTGRSNTAIPAIVSTKGATAIAAGRSFSVALLKGGQVECWGGNKDLGQECRAPALPTTGPGAVVGVSTSENLVIAEAKDGRRYIWAVRREDDPIIDYHEVSQPNGISRAAQGPGFDSWSQLLVWDSKGVLAARNNPYVLPWSLQSAPAVADACTGSREFAAALTVDGRVTLSRNVVLIMFLGATVAKAHGQVLPKQ
jgi:hypothetical protein